MSTLLLALDPARVSAEQEARVREEAPGMQVVLGRERELIEPLLDDIEVIAGNFPRDFFARAQRLRWVQQWGAGADWLLRDPEALPPEVVLTNASGVHPIQIGEHILAFMLAFARSLPQAVRAQERREWLAPETVEVFELAGKTMLLVGVGAIGLRTAALAQALGMRVVGVRRDPSRGAPGIDRMVGPGALEDELPLADFVVLTVPHTRDTEGMIGAAQLAAMKPEGYLVNIGRGGTVREADLVRALRKGQIAGAGLDVFETEPLPEDSPLWGMDNVIITSHYSGLSPHYDERALDIFLDNLRRYRAGEPLRNVVDRELGY